MNPLRDFPARGALLVASFFILSTVASAVDRHVRVVAREGVDSPKPLEVLYFGRQENGHHNPSFLFSVLEPYLQARDMHMTFTDELESLDMSVLSDFDVLMIYGNTLMISDSQEAAMIDFVESGGGLVGIHVASWSFRNSTAYGELLGGRFLGHHAVIGYSHQIAPCPHPILEGYTGYTSDDEPYLHQMLNPDVEVLTWRDPTSAFEISTNFLEPYTWIRTQGLGRVFYHAGGHDNRTWREVGFQDIIARGARWAGGGESYGNLGTAAISSDGTVVFEGGERPGTAARTLWAAGPNKLVQQFALQDCVLPGDADVVWDLESSLEFIPLDEGKAVFLSGLSANGADYEGVLRGRRGVFETIIEGGQFYDIAEPGVVVGSAFPRPAMAASGDFVITSANLGGTGSTDDDTVLLFSGTGPASTVLAREGDPANGQSKGVVYDDMGASSFSMNATGCGAFTGKVRGDGIDASNDTALWRTTQGTVEFIAAEGDAVPGVADVAFGEIGRVRVNSVGDVAFVADLTGTGTDPGNDAAVFILQKGNTAPSVLVREGTSPNGGDPLVEALVFDVTLDGWAFNGNGEVLFASEVFGSGVGLANDRGVWRADGSLVTQVIREGDFLPGRTSGPIVNVDLATVQICSGDADDLMILTPLHIPSMEEVLIAGSGESLFPVFVSGEPVQINGQTETIEQIRIMGGGADDGFPSSMNSAGGAVVVLDLAGGESVVTVPDLRDLDGDTLSGFLEFVVGTDPDSSASGFEALPRLVAAPGGGTRMVFRRIEDAEALGISTVVETSGNLVDWLDAALPVVPAADQTGLPPGVERLEVMLDPASGFAAYRIRFGRTNE